MNVTRKQYDKLIQNHPQWMATTWLRLDRRWYISGCYVIGEFEVLKQLGDLLGE